jgi:hypothetical protein
MARRSIPQAKLDKGAYLPIRIKVLVPGSDFRGLGWDMYTWLDEHVGRGSYALHPACTYGLAVHAVEICFRTIDAAASFFAAFPKLEFADGLMSGGLHCAAGRGRGNDGRSLGLRSRFAG